MLGRRLRLGVIGGGPDSFIGGVHRAAARLDDRYELVAGLVSSDPVKAIADGKKLGLPQDRIYADCDAMLTAERARPDGVDVIAIMTPNDSHFDYASKALQHGFDVICDKPMTNTLAEAVALHKTVIDSGMVFCLTHNYSGYPLVRQARAMIAEGTLGTIRLVQVEYVQGGKAKQIDFTQGEPRPWRLDPQKSGPSLVLGDIGTHAHHLLRFISGLEVEAVSADLGAVVPNRDFHDYAGAMLRLSGGARGNFWVTQAAAGVENSLRIRVSGSLGTLEWEQECPQILRFKPIASPALVFTPNGLGALPFASRSTRIVKGHPEGFIEAFATIYSDAAEAIAARRSGNSVDPLATQFPNSLDGVLGVKFISAALESSQCGSAWVKLA